MTNKLHLKCRTHAVNQLIQCRWSVAHPNWGRFECNCWFSSITTDEWIPTQMTINATMQIGGW